LFSSAEQNRHPYEGKTDKHHDRTGSERIQIDVTSPFPADKKKKKE
jgi:hypothetical protein